MYLLNIHNHKRKIYLFKRDEMGRQIITEDTSFFPFFYEIDQKGAFNSYDGLKLRKVFVSEPFDVPKYRSITSYSSDIPFTKNYLIHKIDKIEKCNIRYFLIDSEMKANDLPDYKNPKETITCITLYDSFTKEYLTWYIEDQITGETLKDKEKILLLEFIKYFKDNPPDLWLSWNVDFDYYYIAERCKVLFGKKFNFAREISPIHQVRAIKNKSKEKEDKSNLVFYPAGISILDYLKLFKKISMREASYALDHIAQKHLKEESWGKTDFSIISQEMKEKNINDVRRMVKLEEKFNVISYYDEIRRLSKCLWEDIYFNSFIIEMLLFQEAKEKNVVLPNNYKNIDTEETEFEGAIREAVVTGDVFDIGKYDLTSAYPNMIVNFCLDIQNIVTNDDTENTVEVNEIKFKQNSETLLPSMVSKILILKNNIKKKLKSLDKDSDEYKKTEILYDAIKAVINSAFGVFGFKGFRLFNLTIASSITFLVRDLLFYVKNNLEKIGYKIIYYDTDGIMIDSKDNIVNIFNELVKNWAKEKYNKSDLSIEFEYEGYFKNIFILTKCRYIGDLVTSKGIKREIKGLEIKRSSSSQYEKDFQETLIEKFFAKESKENIVKFIEEEKNRIKELDIKYISFPCKISNIEYKHDTIFLRAYKYSKEINKKFKLNIGELFHYIFINPTDYEYKEKISEKYYLDGKKLRGIDLELLLSDKENIEKLTKEGRLKSEIIKTQVKDKAKNVLAFSETEDSFIKRDMIDWSQMIRRLIDSKAEKLFQAKGWEYKL